LRTGWSGADGVAPGREIGLDDRVVIDWNRIRRIAVTFAAAGAGGALFDAVGLPAGWLSGGMVGAALLAITGVEVDLPAPLRNIGFVIVGSFLGSSVSPELVGELHRWPISLAVLGANLIVLQFSAQWFLSRFCRWDRQTAFFAAVPGLTSYVIALALPTRADISRIAVSQTIRVFLLVVFMPKAVSLFAVGGTPPTVVPPAGLGEITLILVTAGLGGVAFNFLGIPAAAMLGALLVSGILHGTGLVGGAMPQLLLIAAYITLGALIGTRFAGTTPRMLLNMFAASFGAFLVSLTVASIGAWMAAVLTGTSLSQMILAFAPGGIDVMTIMAFALGLDAAFVAAHQLARFLCIAIYAPLLLKREQKAAEAAARARADGGG
jgi:membrane AbrB-like protein